MKYLYWTVSMLVLGMLGCGYVDPDEHKSDWYAVIENGGPTKHDPVSNVSGSICVELRGTYQTPFWGPDGFGRRSQVVLYWANLIGEGPVYRDPDFHMSNGGLSWRVQHHGTIVVDNQNEKVAIDLQILVSKPGEADRWGDSPANGIYSIRRWVK
jgi:hypothetical protein